MGMYTMGIVAREIGKLFYAASNSYKFVGIFLLNQSLREFISMDPKIYRFIYGQD